MEVTNHRRGSRAFLLVASRYRRRSMDQPYLAAQPPKMRWYKVKQGCKTSADRAVPSNVDHAQGAGIILTPGPTTVILVPAFRGSTSPLFLSKTIDCNAES